MALIKIMVTLVLTSAIATSHGQDETSLTETSREAGLNRREDEPLGATFEGRTVEDNARTALKMQPSLVKACKQTECQASCRPKFQDGECRQWSDTGKAKVCTCATKLSNSGTTATGLEGKKDEKTADGKCQENDEDYCEAFCKQENKGEGRCGKHECQCG